MRVRRSVILAGAALIGGAATATAQKKAASCTWSGNAPWMKRQVEFFDDTKGGWSNDTLRVLLLKAVGIDKPLTMPVSNGVRVEGRETLLDKPAATAAIAELRKLASTRGSAWPTKSVVGAAGAHAVYLIAQDDSVLVKSIHRFMEAGPAESPAIDVAMWEDRLRLMNGRKQIYGTQFRKDAAGKLVLEPMEDSAHADLRREGAGLPPLKLGLCFARTTN